MATVNSKNITKYTLKSGKFVKVTRLFTDILEEKTGAVTKRICDNIYVEGDIPGKDKEEIILWLSSNHKNKLPRIIKQYIKENQ